MKSLYMLYASSESQRISLEYKLIKNGMYTQLHQTYNYVFSEFCNVYPPSSNSMSYIITPHEMIKMVNNLSFFLKEGIPNNGRIRYSQQIEHSESSSSLNTLDSPTREYDEDDFEAVEYCREWLTIGINCGAHLVATLR